MNTTTPEKCPKCGAVRQVCVNGLVVWYECGYSIALHLPDGDHESVQCIINQRDQLAERVKELEAKLADRDEAAACAVIQDARRGES